MVFPMSQSQGDIEIHFLDAHGEIFPADGEEIPFSDDFCVLIRWRLRKKSASDSIAKAVVSFKVSLIKGNGIHPHPCFSSGRNSFSAIVKSSITKNLNGTISSISLKTGAKTFLYNAFNSIGGTIWSGFADASDYYSERHGWWFTRFEEGWL